MTWNYVSDVRRVKITEKIIKRLIIDRHAVISRIYTLIGNRSRRIFPRGSAVCRVHFYEYLLNILRRESADEHRSTRSFTDDQSFADALVWHNRQYNFSRRNSDKNAHARDTSPRHRSTLSDCAPSEVVIIVSDQVRIRRRAGLGTEAIIGKRCRNSRADPPKIHPRRRRRVNHLRDLGGV